MFHLAITSYTRLQAWEAKREELLAAVAAEEDEETGQEEGKGKKSDAFDYISGEEEEADIWGIQEYSQ